MKTLAFTLAAFALALLFTPAVPADEGDGGGSKFADPKEEEPKFPENPVPATFTFKDYRLEMDTDDGRFWSELPIDDKAKEAGVVLFQQMKLPKSADYFDVRIQVQAWEHKVQLTWNDGTKIGASNYKALADKFFENDTKDWKDVKDEEKPKSVKMSRDCGKAFRYALTGNPGGLAVRAEVYLFKFKDKTYSFRVMYSTTAARNETITKQIDEMIRSIREWKEKKK